MALSKSETEKLKDAAKAQLEAKIEAEDGQDYFTAMFVQGARFLDAIRSTASQSDEEAAMKHAESEGDNGDARLSFLAGRRSLRSENEKLRELLTEAKAHIEAYVPGDYARNLLKDIDAALEGK